MGISRLSTKKIGRPQGFKYPVGLSTRIGGSESVNVATNSTGGVQTAVGSNAVHTYTSSGTFTTLFKNDVLSKCSIRAYWFPVCKFLFSINGLMRFVLKFVKLCNYVVFFSCSLCLQ